jgi:hypothetical protein
MACKACEREKVRRLHSGSLKDVRRACTSSRTKREPDYLGPKSLLSRWPRPTWLTKCIAEGKIESGNVVVHTQGWIYGSEHLKYGAEDAYRPFLSAPFDPRYPDSVR